MNSPNAAKIADYLAALNVLKEDHRPRGLEPHAKIDFVSNDYLAFSASIEPSTPIGAGGSCLVHGNGEERESLESEAVKFFGAEAALFFGSGYVANLAVLTTLPQESELLVLESLVPASVHEGAGPGWAHFRRIAHKSVENTVREWRSKRGTSRVSIVVKSLSSMDGDFAPLRELVEITDYYDAVLVVNEAHATSDCSKQGQGLTKAICGAQKSPDGQARQSAGGCGSACHFLRPVARFRGQSLPSVHSCHPITVDGRRRT